MISSASITKENIKLKDWMLNLLLTLIVVSITVPMLSSVSVGSRMIFSPIFTSYLINSLVTVNLLKNNQKNIKFCFHFIYNKFYYLHNNFDHLCLKSKTIEWTQYKMLCLMYLLMAVNFTSNFILFMSHTIPLKYVVF